MKDNEIRLMKDTAKLKGDIMEKLKKVLISDNITIKEALKKMDIAAEKILVIVEKDFKLKGVVTDGDIRRWILKGGGLTKRIDKVMNRHPVYVHENFNKKDIQELMIKKKIEYIPVVNGENKVVSAVRWLDVFRNKQDIQQKINAPVVIMAGGTGTRLHPFTKILPKALIPINDKPIIEMIIDRFNEYGCTHFYVSVNDKAKMIKAYFNDLKHNYVIKFFQEKKPLGTAGSLYLLRNRIKGPFFLSNCDILVEGNYTDILKFHKANKNKITVIASLKHYLIPYGIIEMSKGKIADIIKEKPEYDFYVNTGMYVLDPDVLKDVSEEKFLLMTDLINLYIKKKKNIGVYPISDKSWIDIGQWEELEEALNKIGI